MNVPQMDARRGVPQLRLSRGLCHYAFPFPTGTAEASSDQPLPVCTLLKYPATNRTHHCLEDQRVPSHHDSAGYMMANPVMGPANTETFVGCRVLEADSSECQVISSKFYNDWVKGECPKVDFILNIFCPGVLTEMWEDRRASLANKHSPTAVEQHYHGTIISCDIITSEDLCQCSDCGICGISRNGFQKSRIGSNITFKRFGHGFYLAPHSSKCHDYTQGIHTHRAMLLCDVLPGKKHVVQTNQTHLVAPPQGYDSVYGQPGSALNYPEIVIYDEASILPRYVIVYQKDGIMKIAK